MRDDGFTGALGGRIALALFLVGLVAMSYRVLHLFFVPLAWGLILVYVTWPLHLRLRGMLKPYVSLSALTMSLGLCLMVVLPTLWVIDMLNAELPAAYTHAVALLGRGPEILPPGVAHLPWIGPELERLLRLAVENPDALRDQVLHWLEPLVQHSLTLVGDIGATTLKFAFAVLSAFFLYRDGDRLLDQTSRLLRGLIGGRSESYLKAIGDTTQGVLYGVVMTALLQGVLAGAGYWVAGVQMPILLGVVTTVLALVPLGTVLIMGLACLWLFLTGEVWAAAGLAVWGTIVVVQIDNVLRPLVISSAAGIPYILVLFAVLGGIAEFGMIGLFLGPIVIAVLLAVWREWIAEQGGEV